MRDTIIDKFVERGKERVAHIRHLSQAHVGRRIIASFGALLVCRVPSTIMPFFLCPLIPASLGQHSVLASSKAVFFHHDVDRTRMASKVWGKRAMRRPGNNADSSFHQGPEDSTTLETCPRLLRRPYHFGQRIL
jgi:hypothetical protein